MKPNNSTWDGRRRSERLQKRRERSLDRSEHDRNKTSDGPKKKQMHDLMAGKDTAADYPVTTDNFYSPVNHDFYARQPYRSLEKSDRSIRLLQVSRNSVTGERVYTLTNARSLTEARNTYTAISYCAGDPKDARELLVNGIKFNAFASLARAIDETCYYRKSAHGDTNPLLWTDQICINQSDPNERSHQVGMMYDVYKNAREVAVCLSSSDTEHSEHGACDWVNDMNEIVSLDLIDPMDCESIPYVDPLTYDFDKPNANLDLATPSVRRACNAIQIVMRQVRTRIHEDEFVSGLRDVLSVLTKTWWTRAWTAQEFIASSTAVFVIGRKHIASHMLLAIAVALDAMKLVPIPFPRTETGLAVEAIWESSQQFYYAVATINLMWAVSRNAGLAEVLNDCKFRLASDRRDNIYAYLGLINPGYAIQPDYTEDNSLKKVLIDTARQIIRHQRDLEVLRWALPKKSSVSLPSWVPDWTTIDEESGSGHIHENPFANVYPDAKCICDGEVLSVRGVRLGTLETLKPVVCFDISKRYCIGPNCCVRVTNNEGEVIIGDQAWALFGADQVFMLRKVKKTFKLVCKVNLEDSSGGQYTVDRRTHKPTRIHIS